MARNGHPRVPRKIRGQRRKIAKMQKGYTTLALGRRAARRTTPYGPVPTTITVPSAAVYQELVTAALGSPQQWEQFMKATAPR